MCACSVISIVVTLWWIQIGGWATVTFMFYYFIQVFSGPIFGISKNTNIFECVCSGHSRRAKATKVQKTRDQCTPIEHLSSIFCVRLLLLEVDLRLVNGVACVETKKRVCRRNNRAFASLMDMMRKSFYKYTCRRPLDSSSMSPSPLYRRSRRRYIFCLFLVWISFIDHE